MKRNFSTTLLQFDGKAIKDGMDKIQRSADGKPVFDPATSDVIVMEAAKPATLRSICLGALGSPLEGDDRMAGELKYGLYKLAARIDKGGVVEITTEEQATLKTRIAKAYSSMVVVGAAFDLLEADFVEPPTAIESSLTDEATAT